ncbi:MAG: hypothetical protein LBU74_08475 [Methanobacteriaceae archaeon]|nr:hypothetical protein [Candidatus Methanorudis spinitermitis]
MGLVSAADLTVNSNTSHKNIADWMNDSATVKGNNLIFNVSTYELSDTLILSKSINIKIDKKTQINFNQNKNMFNITASEVSFFGLVLNHNVGGNSKDLISVIFANGSAKVVNIKDTSINLKKNYVVAVSIGNGKCNFINSHITGNGIYNYGVASDTLTVNFQKSSIKFSKNYSYGIVTLNKLRGGFTNTKISLQGIGIFSPDWKGNFINSEFTGKSESFGIYVEKWNGKISRSKIILSGKDSVGMYSENSKGTIFKSTIHAKKGGAIFVSKDVKVSGSSIISKKGEPSVYYFGPRMDLLEVSSHTKSKTYTFKISNIGESKSKTSYLRISIGKFEKIVKVKGINAGENITVKTTLPAAYSTSKHKKVANMIFLNSAGKKEVSETLHFKL